MSQRRRRAGWLVAGTLVLNTIVSTPAFARDDQGDVAVVPGDQTGLFAPPSVGLSASSPGSSGGSGNSGSSGAGPMWEKGSGGESGTGSDNKGSSSGSPPLFEYAGEPSAPENQVMIPYSSGPFVPVPLQNPQPGEPPAPSPTVLAQQAYEQLELPLPTPRHSPDVRLADGRSATVVGEYTWFWTDPADWHPHTKRVEAAGVWAEVTARPVRLSLTPGNGHETVSCAGPGTPYDRSYGLHAPSPTCDVVYRHSSVGQPGEQVRAEWSITWQVSWTSSTGESGQLPPMTSRAATRFAVAEAQALQTK